MFNETYPIDEIISELKEIDNAVEQEFELSKFKYADDRELIRLCRAFD